VIAAAALAHLNPARVTLLVISAGLAGAWLLMLWVMAAATRQPPVHAGPATGDLGPEPPAVAGMLAHDGRVGGEAAAATLLDLAARHVIDLEEVGPQLSLCRIRQRDGQGLAPYERRILSFLEALAVSDVVPAQALAKAGRPAGWWRRLRAEVVADARDRGLSRPRWSLFVVTCAGLLAALPGAAFGLALAGSIANSDVPDGAIVGAVIGGGLAYWLNTDRLTSSGAAAAGRWLGVSAHLAADKALTSQPAAAVTIYGRYLAYGAAFGVARAAVESLPIGKQGNIHAGWSTYGTGLWHKVDISYSWRPFSGRAPRWLLTRQLALAAAGAAVGWLLLKVLPEMLALPPGFYESAGNQEQVHKGHVLMLAGGWLAVALAVVALAACVPAGADMIQADAVEGEVVRTRRVVTRADQQGHPVKVRYWIAVDDGTSHAVRAWRVGRALYRRVNQTDIVRARVTRHYHYVSALQVLVNHPKIDVEAGLPPQQRAQGSADRAAAAITAGLPALFGGPGALDPAALLTADDAAALLGAPVGEAQPLDPRQQIPNASDPLGRAARLSACRWATADGGRSADVLSGQGLAASSLIGSLLARTRKTAGNGHGGRLGRGAMIAGNTLIISRKGKTLAVILNDADPDAAGPTLERLVPVLSDRLDASREPDQAASSR
jgi:Predicted membrane protein (DUF2207)